jgi:hypothetical protein
LSGGSKNAFDLASVEVASHRRSSESIMRDQYSRRAVCGAIGAVLLGGCVEGASDDPSDNSTQSPDNDTMDSTDDSSTGNSTPISPEERQQLVDQLPETSPLSGSLVDLVAASDRETAAAEQGYELRSKDHSVQVMIRLESDHDLPTEYRADVVDNVEGYVTAYVHIDDLVPLAMEDAVRKIQRPPTSQPHGAGQRN